MRRHCILLTAALLGCQSTGGSASSGSHPVPVPEGGVPAPSATPTATPEPTPTPGPVTYPQPCGDLYDPSKLPMFKLEVPPATWDQMKTEYAQKIENWYGPVTFKYGTETRTDVMIRNRGNNSRCGEKLQITIAFHKVDSGRRFHGLRRIDLDHGGKHCRTVQERAALAFMREDLGLEAQCANHALLVVNGEYYGLYSNLEHQDREFLERNFPDPDGNLYKNGDEKKTNESDPDTSDIEAFWDATTPAALEALTDMDAALLEWAAEAAIPAVDNYWFHGWNYYLYNDPARGFVFLPNDMDQAEPTSSTIALDPLPAHVDPARWLLSHPEWRDRYLDTLEEVHAKLDPARMASRIDAYWAQVGAAAESDPFLRWDADADRFAAAKQGWADRKAFLGEWLTCTRHPAPGMDADGDGYPWCNDCRDTDILAYPGAPERCGDGLDDDCDGVADEGCLPLP